MPASPSHPYNRPTNPTNQLINRLQPDLDPGLRKRKEAELAQLQAEHEGNKRAEKERKLATRYHHVRGVEEQGRGGGEGASVTRYHHRRGVEWKKGGGVLAEEEGGAGTKCNLRPTGDRPRGAMHMETRTCPPPPATPHALASNT